VAKKLKLGDTVRIRILEAEKVDPPGRSEPEFTKARLDALKRKSHRFYLALYRKQRRELDRQIAWIERDMKSTRGPLSAVKGRRRPR
jgi:hypothetical protein